MDGHAGPDRTQDSATPTSDDEAGADLTSTVLLPTSRSVWRFWFALLVMVGLGLLLRFVVSDGGNVIFTVLMSWFAAVVMEPVVRRLSRHMRRGAATGLVMGSVALFGALFLVAFGGLFVQQLVELIRLVPELIDGVLKWANQTFDMSLTRDSILSSVDLSSERIAQAAQSVGVSLLGFLGSVVGGLFSVFTFGLFVFYLSADMPRLAGWVASLFPPQRQRIVATVWTLTAEKTGGYVGARLVLAAINAGTTAIVFVAIGMPYWLPLALWTGIVAQFVPTIGTYISIALPVIVGLLSPNPAVGVIALVWAVIYQQVENLTIEPKISARAVDVNPAVSFGAVLLGAALFGVAGALLAVPVAAMLLALLDIYGNRYELLPDIASAVDEASPRGRRVPERAEGDGAPAG